VIGVFVSHFVLSKRERERRDKRAIIYIVCTVEIKLQ